MAFFRNDETPTDEPFTRHLTPLEVSTAVQSALSAVWFTLPAGQKSAFYLERLARQLFDAVEQWWLKLEARTGAEIVAASQKAYGPPALALEQSKAGTLKIETMMSWVRSSSFADAFFWAWLLQSEHDRTPSGTARLVRMILERQIRSAGEDLEIFSRMGL